jgi:LacI family transcriptional regulator
MATYLLSLGHRKFGYIYGPREQRAPHDRFAGFCEALAERGMELSQDYVLQGDDHFDSGVACTRELLKLTPRPSAIIANNDEMALGALVAGSEMNYSVPKQLSIAGFDDIPHARQVWPPLTTVRQPIYEMAVMATNLLIRILQGEVITELHHEIPTELIIRGSTCIAETESELQLT